MMKEKIVIRGQTHIMNDLRYISMKFEWCIMLQKEIERYETIVIETSIKIIVYKNSNKFAEYYALASFQNSDGVFQKSDGSAKTVEKAKIECEIAVQLDVILNRQTPLQILSN